MCEVDTSLQVFWTEIILISFAKWFVVTSALVNWIRTCVLQTIINANMKELGVKLQWIWMLQSLCWGVLLMRKKRADRLTRWLILFSRSLVRVSTIQQPSGCEPSSVSSPPSTLFQPRIWPTVIEFRPWGISLPFWLQRTSNQYFMHQ